MSVVRLSVGLPSVVNELVSASEHPCVTRSGCTCAALHALACALVLRVERAVRVWVRVRDRFGFGFGLGLGLGLGARVRGRVRVRVSGCLRVDHSVERVEVGPRRRDDHVRRGTWLG